MKTKIKPTFPIPITSARRYQLISDQIHDSLVRCRVCKIKYMLSELKCTDTGHYVCKFCINSLGGSSVQNY